MDQTDGNLFQTLAPNMMRPTRMLLIDHDVTRYHSFDLLKYQLYLDVIEQRPEHFTSIEPEHRILLDNTVPYIDQVHHMQTRFRHMNIYRGFSQSLGVETMEQYTECVHRMLDDPIATVTPTDVSRGFDVVFRRKDITGYLLRYRGDSHKPRCYDQLITYEAENLLRPDSAVRIIMENRINAVMIASAPMALALATALLKQGHTEPTTYIIARYGYNFVWKDGVAQYPVLNNEFGELEIAYHHEFGYFDPFSGLTRLFKEKRGDLADADTGNP